MSVIGSDSREVITAFGTFPFSTVTTVDIETPDDDFFGTGITIGPNHVLTAGHNPYDIDTNTFATSLRTTTSANQNGLNDRGIGAMGDPAANVTNFNFLADYDTTEALGDDIALFTTSDAPIAASNVIGLLAFVDPETADGLTIDTAGYPEDNVSSDIPGNTGEAFRDLVRSPGAAEAPGEIVDTRSNRRFFYSPNVDTAGGQSGSGVWHTLDGDSNPRVLGVHTQGPGYDPTVSALLGLRNSGVLITTDIYDEIIAQIEADSGTANANALPENAIIGSEPDFFSFLTGNGDDDIFGSYRRERIIGNGGDDRMLGGGADDRLEGGDGVDQALFSDIFTNYDFTITDPANPAFEFSHTGGSQNDGMDTTQDTEFGVFEFVDADEDGSDDDEDLFFVPLQVDPNDDTKLKDGPEITAQGSIIDPLSLPGVPPSPIFGEQIGTVSVESPAWMFDGDVDYTLTIGSEQGILYNFAYIIDISGSVSGTPLAQAKAAYESLTQSLIDDSVAANSEFAVVPFSSFASLLAPLDASTAISTVNGLTAFGSTNFNSALLQAVNFFNSPSRNVNATNIAYFLSDGFSNVGGDFSANAAALQNLAEVRAFGIGNADLDQLNIVDSDNAVLLSDPADLVTEFNEATVERDIIERIDVSLDGNVIDTITPGQLVEDTLGLQFEGTIDGLEVTRTAENEITFDVVFNDDTPTASVNYTITTGQEEVRTQTDDGTREVIVFSVNQADFTGSNESASIEREIVGNDLDNTIEVQSGENTIFGNGGNDRFVLSGGINLVDGGEGIDTAVINTTRAEAGGVTRDGNVVNVGTDNTLLNVEFIEFSDVRLSADTLVVTPTLSLAERAIEITEGNADSTTATFTVNLSSAATEDVVIDFTTRSDDADAGTDFVETTDQLTIAAGESSGDIALEILGDTDVEGDEAVFLDLTVVSGGTFAEGGMTETAGVNILDDDSVITVPITADDPTVIEGDPNTPSTLSLTLDRFGSVSESDTIEVETIPAGDNPAQASDFVNGFSSSQVTFAPGEETKTVDIPINPDREIEGDETFGIRLTNISGSALVPDEDIIFTILDDDTDNTQPNVVDGTSARDNLTGTDGDDLITGGQGRDTLTGGESGDQFVYTSIVEAGDIITDFEVGVDQIVLAEVLNSFDYQGEDAIADGYVQLSSQGTDSFIQIDPDGAVGSGRSRPFILVENVTVANLNNTNNFVFS